MGSEKSPCKYALGAWQYSKKFDHLTENKQAESEGIYFLVDQSFGDTLSAFARYGTASTATNPVQSNAAAGVVIKGLIPIRPDDRLGVSMTQVHAAEEQEYDTETTYELTYRVNFGHGVSLQPDLQYVLHPNFSSEVKDGFIGALRLEVGL